MNNTPKGGSCWQLIFASTDFYPADFSNFIEDYFITSSLDYTDDGAEQISAYADMSFDEAAFKEEAALRGITIPAYEKIRAVLEKKNRASWMKDEMQILLNPETYAPDLMQLWRKIKINTKKPLVLKTLQVLTAWREMDAQRADKPRRSMLKDDTLIELAMARPTSMEALKSLRGMSSGHFPKNARGQEIVDLIKNVSLTPKEEKEFLLLTEQKKKKVCHGCVEALRLLLESVSETEQVAPKIICHAEDLEKIAAEGKNADVPAMKGWRFDIFGRHALELIEGKIGLFFDSVGQKMKITGKS